jgi:Bacterial archaeo-eukaryotic release factor family 10
MTSTSSNGSVLKGDDLAERWDAIEERERKIGSMQGARTKGRLPTVRPQAPTLIKDLQAEHFVTSAELRELATRTYRQPVISVYLNLTPDRAGRGPGAYLTMEEIESLDAFVPTDTVDAGRPGKVQRHRLTPLRWHLKTAADLTARLFTERGFSLLILSGDRRVLAEFERFLPDWLGGKVTGRLHPGPRQDRAEWQRQIEQVLREHRRAEEEAALSRLADYLGSGLVRRGLVPVLEVVNQFLVRMLFVSVELKEPGFVLPPAPLSVSGAGTLSVLRRGSAPGREHNRRADRIRQVARRRADGDRREARAPRSSRRRGRGNVRPAGGVRGLAGAVAL